MTCLKLFVIEPRQAQWKLFVGSENLRKLLIETTVCQQLWIYSWIPDYWQLLLENQCHRNRRQCHIDIEIGQLSPGCGERFRELLARAAVCRTCHCNLFSLDHLSFENRSGIHNLVDTPLDNRHWLHLVLLLLVQVRDSNNGRTQGCLRSRNGGFHGCDDDIRVRRFHGEEEDQNGDRAVQRSRKDNRRRAIDAVSAFCGESQEIKLFRLKYQFKAFRHLFQSSERFRCFTFSHSRSKALATSKLKSSSTSTPNSSSRRSSTSKMQRSSPLVFWTFSLSLGSCFSSSVARTLWLLAELRLGSSLERKATWDFRSSLASSIWFGITSVRLAWDRC